MSHYDFNLSFSIKNRLLLYDLVHREPIGNYHFIHWSHYTSSHNSDCVCVCVRASVCMRACVQDHKNIPTYVFCSSSSSFLFIMATMAWRSSTAEDKETRVREKHSIATHYNVSTYEVLFENVEIRLSHFHATPAGLALHSCPNFLRHVLIVTTSICFSTPMKFVVEATFWSNYSWIKLSF